MDFKLSVISVFFIISLCHASIIPTVKVLQGPGSKTTLIGPDGSAIDSVAPGGTVVTDPHGSGLVAAGPAILPLGPGIVVTGPSGSIITSHSSAGPAVVPAVVPGAVGIVASTVLGDPELAGPLDNGDGNNNEGAYVDDKAEALYDDGSYKGEQ